MFEIIKNMFRRKLRTALTVFGIAIGILALVVMGGIAEKLDLLVKGGTDYYADKVQVQSAESNFFITTPLTLDKGEELKKVDGAKCVAASIGTTLDKELEAVNFGPPPLIQGRQTECDQYESFEITLTDGRDITDDDRGKVVLGADLIKKFEAEIGKEIEIRGKKYEIVGLMEKTFTAPDSVALMSFHDAQLVIYEDLPEIVKSQLKATEVTNGFIVNPDNGTDPNELARTLESEVKDIKAVGPKDFEDSIASTVGTFTSIIYGIAIISLLVGTLSIINTMTMSISERTKEIGVKKAIGAKTQDILIEYLTEAGLIGLLGGAIGIGLGTLLVYVINSAMEKTGDKIFLLTPRLLWGALIFSVVLGVVAGIYPALHAARLSIVKSLREE
ncbi:MAG: ABC transporter permease [Patescibacteria group bacterium]|nr:ABC transporter permease [Patescibacteria group bacterium]